MSIEEYRNTKEAEMLAGMLLRMAYSAETEHDWAQLNYRIANLESRPALDVTQLVRDSVAAELRSLHHRLHQAEVVLDKLDRQLIELEQA